MIVNHHVTADLSDVETIVPYLQQTDRLVGDDMEDKDIECMVAGIYEEPFEPVLPFVYPTADVVGHQESEDSWYRKRQKLFEGRPPVHVGREILGEKEYDDGEQ